MRRKYYRVIRRSCKCGCGDMARTGCSYISGHNLRGEMTRPPLHAKAGDVFGWLTVLHRAPNTIHSKHGGLRAWYCECKCGTVKIIADRYLFLGSHTSCGCQNVVRIRSGLRFRHGMSGSPEHVLWASMRQRVKPTSRNDRRWYADRGIKVCQGWQLFENFYSDLGRRPTSKHSLDRKDNDGHYSCGKCDECTTNGWTMNVRWATPQEQGLNKRQTRYATINGTTKPWAEWCALVGVSTGTAKRRIERDGWTLERALTTPPKQQRRAV